MIRAFIAINLPLAIKDSLTTTIARLREQLPGDDFGWVRVDGAHLTLRFIGNIDEERVDTITHTMGKAAEGISPFELTLDGFGTFPPGKDARVLWTGLGGDLDTLSTLQYRIADAINGLGLEPEARSFSPHLTLARIRGPISDSDMQALTDAMGAVHLDDPRFEVNSIGLIQSELHRNGARYTKLGTAKLTG